MTQQDQQRIFDLLRQAFPQGEPIPISRAQEVLKAQGEELSRQAGGLSPFLTAFFSGRRLTQKEAEELKQLIDQHTWEG